MPYYKITISLIAGICLGFGLLYLFIGLRRKNNKPLNLTLALFALCYATTLFNGVRWYSTTIATEFIAINCFDALFVAGAFVSLAWYMAYYTGVRPRIFLWGLSAALIVPSLVFIITPATVIGEVSGLTYITLPWGENLADLDATGSVWLDAALLAQLVTLGYIIFALIRQFWRGERRPALILGLGMLPFIAGIFYEVLGESGVVPYIPFGEFGFLGIAIVASLQMANSVIRTEEERDQFRLNLEGLVETRTAQLVQANESLALEVAERQQAEEKVRAAGEFVQSALDALSSNIAILDETGTILAVNASWRRFGAENDLKWENYGVGRNYLNVIETAGGDAVGDAVEASRGIRAVASGQRDLFRVEYPCHSPDRKCWFLMHVTRFYSADGVRVVTAHEDITERKQIEVALRQSEARFRKVFEEGPIGMALVAPDFRLMQVNATLCRMLGYTEDELTALTFADITHPDDVDNDVSLAQQVFAGHIPYFTIEKRYIKRNDDILWGKLTASVIRNDAGQPVYGLGMIEDITDRKRAEQALNQRLEELSILHYVAEVLARTTDLPATLQAMSETLMHWFEALYVHVIIPELTQDDQRFIVGFERGSGPIAYHALDLSLEALPLIGEVIRKRQTQVFSNLQPLQPDPVIAAFIKKRNIQHVIVVPLLVHGSPIGLMTVASDDAKRNFSPDEIKVTETIASDIAAAVENTRLTERAKVVAVAEARGHLARDLHDSVTQTLYSASLVAEALPQVWENNPAEIKDHLTIILQLIRGALAEMRTLLLELRPETLDKANLATLLRQLGAALTGQTQIPVQLTVKGQPPALPAEVKMGLFRMAQEIFNNISKHAHATEVSVNFENLTNQV
ncbi:MAG: PAS domain S-box protein, partial [Anaerolineae bacterium]|nr:PAS domain S-box protein [Anaerolineae bacterium]